MTILTSGEWDQKALRKRESSKVASTSTKNEQLYVQQKTEFLAKNRQDDCKKKKKSALGKYLKTWYDIFVIFF